MKTGDMLRAAAGGAAGGGGGEFAPDDLSGLAAWFDFSDGATLFTDAGVTPVVADGDAIYQANDKSGTGNHLVQSSAGARPLYKTAGNGINSKSVALFDNTDDAMKKDPLVASLPQPFTQVAVVKIATEHNMQAAMNTVGGLALPTLLYRRADGFWGLYGGTENCVGAEADTNTIILLAQRGVGASILYSDGVPSLTQDPGPWGMEGVQIGYSINNTQPFDGRVAEVLLFDRSLTTQEKNDLGNYLADKWGTTWTTVA